MLYPETVLRDGKPFHPFSLYPQALFRVKPDRVRFSILVRQTLNKRASFASVDALEGRIRQFIEQLAKPFRWTFDGKLLKV